MSFKSRLKRIEKQLNIKRDDEIEELVLNDGRIIRITHGALNEFFNEIWKNNTKRLTGSTKNE